MDKSFIENRKLCKQFGVTVHRVGDVYDTDKVGEPIPEANKGKWFVAALVGQFDVRTIESIPLASSPTEAEALAVRHLCLRDLQNGIAEAVEALFGGAGRAQDPVIQAVAKATEDMHKHEVQKREDDAIWRRATFRVVEGKKDKSDD